MEIRDDVVSKKLDGEEILLQLRSGTYFGLNETGTFLFELVKKGASKDDLITAVAEEFQVDAQSAARDVEEFFEALSINGFIKS